ncbi:putative PPM-type phosphatase domain, mitochondrial carrier domain superfamily [Helianthus anomalus]
MQTNPKIAYVGSCCLAGISCNGMLHVASAGDSKAVLGKQVDKTEKAFMPVRLSQDHNANDGSVREDLIALFPNDLIAEVTKDLTAGKIGGAAQLIAGHPFDTIKVKLQSQPTPPTGQLPRYFGAIDAVKQTLAAEGPWGLYKGMGPHLPM